MIFVRHGRGVADRAIPTRDWPLDPEYVDDVAALRAVLPALPLVCSDMRRAIETAELLGAPTVDPRLTEVARGWTDDLEAANERYFRGDQLDGWEPQDAARARVQAVVADHGPAIYVSHGTVLSLYLTSIVPTLNAMEFWAGLTNPDAWRVGGEQLIHLCQRGRDGQ